MKNAATAPTPERLQRLEDEVARLKLAYLARRRGIPEDDPELVATIVEDVRRERGKLFEELYGTATKTAARLR